MDEPRPYEIEPVDYMSNLMYQGALVGAPDNTNAILKPTLHKDYTIHQYLNIGSSDTYRPEFVLRDIYPIDTTNIHPGDPGYNDYIQDRWENILAALE